MIITRHKPLNDILSFIGNKKNVFLIGCKLCATTCGTGGEAQIKEMEKVLSDNGKTVTGWAVLEPACNLLEVKRLVRRDAAKIGSADAIISFACGSGTQTAADVIIDKDIYPGNDTLFQGEITEMTLKTAKFEQKCSLCGDCMLAITGGMCPVTRCPKGLSNGPCGGVKNKKCEIDPELDCVWILIYDRLKNLGKLSEMRKVRRPKDHGKIKGPRKLTRG